MISVIFPTRNRADLLKLALQSLTQQTLSQESYEILVIDNGSTDQTANIAKEFIKKLPNLRYFHAPEPGLHTGRNKGMLEAKGDILVYADDDIEAFPTWLETIKNAFNNPDIAMVGGNNIPLFLEEPPEWLTALWERPILKEGRYLPSLSLLYLKGESRLFSPSFVWGCNFSIRKSLLLEARGFHPDGMPKELIRFRGDGETYVSQFVINSGSKCLFHPDASVYHKVTPERMTFEYFYQRGFNQGVSDSYTILRNKNLNQPLIKRNFLRRIASWLLSKLRELSFRNKEAKQALNELNRGYQKGFAYHQQCYREDVEVQAWVHKATYF